MENVSERDRKNAIGSRLEAEGKEAEGKEAEGSRLKAQGAAPILPFSLQPSAYSSSHSAFSLMSRAPLALLAAMAVIFFLFSPLTLAQNRTETKDEEGSPGQAGKILVFPEENQPTPSKPIEIPTVEITDDLGKALQAKKMPQKLLIEFFSGKDVPKGHEFYGKYLLFIDLRPASEFEKKHITQALNIPAEKVKESIESGRLKDLDRSSVLILMGADKKLMRELKKAGFQNLYTLEGTLDSWKELGGSLSEAALLSLQSVPPAAQIPPTTPAWVLESEKLEIPTISVKEVHEMVEKKGDFLLIDVRHKVFFDEAHIPGAIHMPMDDLQQKWETLPKDQIIVLYCGSVDCPLSTNAARFLMWRGLKNIKHVPEGIRGWREAGLPIEEAGKKP